MPLEIERKFLVTGNEWLRATGRHWEIRQQTILRDPATGTMRIRITKLSPSLRVGLVTYKSPSTPNGMIRQEFEWEAPAEQLERLMDSLGGPKIEKSRYEVLWDHRVWSVDVFFGANAGLVLAEIEFKTQQEADDLRHLPIWVGQEVTRDPAYFNGNLELFHFSKWDTQAPNIR